MNLAPVTDHVYVVAGGLLDWVPTVAARPVELTSPRLGNYLTTVSARSRAGP